MAYTAGRIIQLSPRRFKVTLLDDGGHDIVVKEITDSKPTAEYLSKELDITFDQAEGLVYECLGREKATMFGTWDRYEFSSLPSEIKHDLIMFYPRVN